MVRRWWTLVLLSAMVAAAVVLLALQVAPRAPRTFTIGPDDGVVVFEPGEARPGDRISCRGHGAVEVEPPGGRVVMPTGLSATTEADGSVFASCIAADL